MRELLVVGGKLGELIRIAREKKGLSRTKLAEFAGFSANSMVRYELAGTPDGKYPPAQKLVKICRVLEIDPRNAFDAMLNDVDQTEEQDRFRFSFHFRTNEDWRNWKLQVKDIETLNDHLNGLDASLHYLLNNVDNIKDALIENDPDLDLGPDLISREEFSRVFPEAEPEPKPKLKKAFKKNDPDQKRPGPS